MVAIGLVERVCELNAAISEPNRMKMIKVLGSNPPPGSVSVSEVAQILGISQPTATKHLKVLHAVGFVHRRRAGARILYALNLETIEEYRRSMDFAFAHATTPCVHKFDCHTCTFRETCV